jgi:hypothetical protein
LLKATLSSSEQYLSYIQYENKFNNIYINYIEMREEMGRLAQQILS